MQPQLFQMQGPHSSAFVPQKRSPALKFGLILGLVLGAIHLAYLLLPYYSGFRPPFEGSIVNFLYPLLTGISTSWPLMEHHQALVFSETFPVYLLLLLFSLLAGVLAARQTKSVSTGAHAGLIVGLIYTLIDTLLVSLILNISLFHATHPYLYVVYSLVSGAIFTLFSLSLGALGGLMERGQRTP